MSTTHDLPEMPWFALLSRTRFHSPVIHSILTGCIRFCDKADAIFVGRNAIKIKEYGSDRLLSDVLTLSNFASPIVAAVVLGKRLSKHLPRPNRANAGLEIKQEPQDHDMNIEAIDPSSPPPHILAVLVESGELVFISFLHPGESQDSVVHHKCQPLPEALDALEDWRFLAVDPDSRALSVASWNGKVALVTLSASMGVQSVLLFETKMTILLMEFIYPNPSENDSIYLLLVGRKEDRFRFMLYSWDLSKPLTPVKPIARPLEHQNPVPSLLIPLQFTPGAFLLASQQRLTIYEGVTIACIVQCAEFTGRPVHIPEPSHNPESSVEQPPWTNWARAARWYERTDAIYLAREDGVIYSIEISKDHESSNELASYKVGALDFVGSGEPTCLRGNIGGAFTSFDPVHGNHAGPDIILFAGDLSDGAHYEIGQDDKDTTTNPKRLALRPDEKETLYNWAPFLHVTVVPPKTALKDAKTKNPFRSRAPVSRDKQVSNRGRIFGTCGKGAWGAVCEMRFGHEYIVNASFDAKDWLSGASNMWSVQNQRAGWKLNFVTNPYSTLCFDFAAEGNVDLISTDPEPTVVLAHLGTSNYLDPSHNSIIQIRPAGIRLLEAQQIKNEVSGPNLERATIQSWPMEHIVGAAVDANSGVLALAMRENHQASVYLGRIHRTGSQEWLLTQLGENIPCTDVPTCLEILRMPAVNNESKNGTNGSTFSVASHFLLFATTSADLCFTPIHPELRASPVQRVTLLEDEICETLCVVPTEHGQGYWIVSGHRDGRLLLSEMLLQHDGSSITLGRRRVFNSGAHSPSIQVVLGLHHYGCIIYGGIDTCFLNLRGNNIDVVALENIWTTDRANRSLRHSVMAALCTFKSENDQGQEPMLILCLSPLGQASLGSLVGACEPLPRRIPIIGTPSRLIYSSHLQCLIVASTEVLVDLERCTRSESSIITLLDPDGEVPESELGDEDGARSGAVYENQLAFRLPEVAESIRCLVEWQCTRGTSRYHFLIIGTAASVVPDAVEGYLHFLRLISHGDGSQELSMVKTSQERGPVRAICVWDDKCFLYCAGNSIRMRTMTCGHDVSFTKTKLVELSSPGVHLECRNDADLATSVVVVTLLEGSTRLYRFNEDKTALELQLSDVKARLGLSHIMLHDKNLILHSDKDQNIAGFLVPERNSNRHATNPLFSAKVAASVTRILECDIRPPWKRRSPELTSQKDLLAVTTDGSLLSLSVLNEHTWRLLRFIVNMALRDPRLDFIGKARFEAPWQSHIEPDTSNPGARHIDGDLLACLLDRPDAVTLMNDMLTVPPHPEAFEAETDFDTATARRERFVVLADAALASAHDSGIISGQDELILAQGDPIQWSLRYIRSLLESPL